ncbi:MAG: CDP-diacylglycerol--glycerol-3-phosphate 3-phosphatidyltransferase [Verrucomicrobiae bacterium]|nr:CDP-diacylglycerol--glycerol-3-phosphate 3-phosphatidyltransferase [Verrucomicrobiae bacterium]
MNLPNRITVARLFLAGIFFVFFFDQPLPYFLPGRHSTPYHYTIAFFCFLIACVSDWSDGYLARRFNQVTSFGKFWDPIADKILVMVAWITLVANQAIPAWIVVVLLGRDFAVSGLRIVAAEQGMVMAAEAGGKIKTFAQLLTIGIISAHYALAVDWGWNVELPKNSLAWFECKGLVWFEFWCLYPLCLITTLYSAWSYFYRNWGLMKTR